MKRNGQSTAMLKIDNESKALFLEIKNTLAIDKSSEALTFICKEYVRLKQEIRDISKTVDEIIERQKMLMESKIS